jgi:hypothetical protein
MPILTLKKLRKLDVFGSKIDLRFNNKKVYKTNCGLCLTLLVSLITIIASIYYG